MNERDKITASRPARPSSTCASRAPPRSSTIASRPIDSMRSPPKPVNLAGPMIASSSSMRTSGSPVQRPFQKWAPGDWPGLVDRFGRRPRVCLRLWSCLEIPSSGSLIVVPLAADRSGLGVLDEVDPDFHLDWFQSPRSSPYRLHSLLDWRERAPTQASSSCVSIPCPPESGPSAPDLRTSNDRIVSSKRDVRVFHKGNFPSSRSFLIYLDRSKLDPFTNSPDHSRSAVAGHASYSSRASGTIPFSDSWRCIASHFAFAYRVAYLV
jgi:hypothetical protein